MLPSKSCLLNPIPTRLGHVTLIYGLIPPMVGRNRVKQKFLHFRNFSFTAQQPTWQKSCSKMWPIEQLYIELGLTHSTHLVSSRRS